MFNALETGFNGESEGPKDASEYSGESSDVGFDMLEEIDSKMHEIKKDISEGTKIDNEHFTEWLKYMKTIIKDLTHDAAFEAESADGSWVAANRAGRAAVKRKYSDTSFHLLEEIDLKMQQIKKATSEGSEIDTMHFTEWLKYMKQIVKEGELPLTKKLKR